MHDAGLNHGIREHSGNGIWEALEAIDDGDQDVVGSPALDLVHDPQPELGALALLDPQAQYFLVTGGTHAGPFRHCSRGVSLNQTMALILFSAPTIVRT